jgi:hypothetical protein
MPLDVRVIESEIIAYIVKSIRCHYVVMSETKPVSKEKDRLCYHKRKMIQNLFKNDWLFRCSLIVVRMRILTAPSVSKRSDPRKQKQQCKY